VLIRPWASATLGFEAISPVFLNGEHLLHLQVLHEPDHASDQGHENQEKAEVLHGALFSFWFVLRTA
jgi:hypothetical protein